MARDTNGVLRACSILMLIAGIWMIITPFALGGGGGAKANDLIFGILLVICSIGRLAAPSARGFSVANLIWGIWLIISPWALHFVGAGMRWSNDVTGIVVVIVSSIALTQRAHVVAFPESQTGPTRRAA